MWGQPKLKIMSTLHYDIGYGVDIKRETNQVVRESYISCQFL